MIRHLTLLLAMLASACAPKAIIVEPLAPQVAKAHGEVKAAAAGAKRVQVAVTASHAQAKTIAGIAGEIVVETERLRRIPGVTPGEFDALWMLATDIRREAFAHEIHQREAVAASGEAVKLGEVAVTASSESVQAAIKTDKGVSELKGQIAKHADDASLGRAMKRFVWMAAIILVLGAIFLIALKIKPSII